MVQVKMQGQSEGERLAKVLCLGDCWQVSFGSSSHHHTLQPPFSTCPDKTPSGSLSFHSGNSLPPLFFALFYQTQLYIRFARRDDYWSEEKIENDSFLLHCLCSQKNEILNIQDRCFIIVYPVIPWLVGWLLFCQIDTNQSPGKELPLSDWPAGVSAVHFLD